MTDEVSYLTDRASAAKLAEHLTRCDADYFPPLSDRVDLDRYAAKLAANARRFEAWAGGTLVGLLAVYLPSTEPDTAHISNVSVLKAWRGRGIAATLMRHCFDEAARSRIQRITLEVAEANIAAIALYQRTGFIPTGRNGAFTVMTATLNADHRHFQRRPPP
jgi:ribosomal protein S18 acetylase RimI-like enzyme